MVYVVGYRKKSHRYQWDVLPMGNEVINRVNALGRAQKQPMVASNFVFKWDHDGNDIGYESESDDDDDDDDFGFTMHPQPILHVMDED